MGYKSIKTDSLEIFKQNEYFLTDIGYVSNNAYLSIVATNRCQCNCPYCINSETDRRLEMPLNKALTNIKKLVAKYHVKEAIILGGEPLLYSEITELISSLKTVCGLKVVRLTTNGIRLVSLMEHPIKISFLHFVMQVQMELTSRSITKISLLGISLLLYTTRSMLEESKSGRTQISGEVIMINSTCRLSGSFSSTATKSVSATSFLKMIFL